MGAFVRKWAWAAAVLAIAAVGLFGCLEDPVSGGRSSNSKIYVGLLFEHEGCRVYRFTDGGRSHYYARCLSSSVETFETHSENCGKNCTRTVETRVPTVPR